MLLDIYVSKKRANNDPSQKNDLLGAPSEFNLQIETINHFLSTILKDINRP